MSVSSNSRKDSNESHATKQRRSTMGIHPESGLAQLNDKNLENDLPSRVADINSTNMAESLTEIKADIATNDDSDSGMSDRDIKESQRASWGQPPLPANAEDASADGDGSMTAYQQSNSLSTDDKVDDADWNRSTAEGAMPATRANEPDRTLGNS